MQRFSTVAPLVVLLALGTTSSCGSHPGADLEPRALSATVALEPAVRASIEAALTDVRSHMDDPETRVALGRAFATGLLHDAACESFEQARTLGGDDARTSYYLGHSLFALGRQREALAALALAGEREPGYVPLHWQRGYWLLDLDDTDAAEASFRAALAIDAQDGAAIFGLARVHLQRGEAQRAVTLLESYVAGADANVGQAYLMLSQGLRRLERANDADAALARSRSGVPHWPDPWLDELAAESEGFLDRLGRAKSRVSAGDTAAAIAILEDLKSDPSASIAVYTNLGVCYLREDRAAEASEQLREGMRLFAPTSKSHHLMATAMWVQVGRSAGDKRAQLVSSALAQVTAALVIDPRSVPSLGLLGKVRFEQRDYSAAANAFAEAARWEPANPAWDLAAARALGRAGRWSEAVPALERTAAALPDDIKALGMLGTAYMQCEQFDRARAVFNTVRDRSGGDPAMYRSATAALRRLDEVSRAR